MKDDLAFPGGVIAIKLNEHDKPAEVKSAGLTKRELFAAMAMQGLLASPKKLSDNSDKVIASYATFYADALIKKLGDE